MSHIIYMNGQYVPEADARVSVFDHGLLYGDGIFEGIRAYNGRVFRLERHIDRLFASAKAIDLHLPHSHQAICDIVVETCRQNGIHNGYVRLVITRGRGDLGIDPRKCKDGPTFFVIARPSIQIYDGPMRGLKAITSVHRRVAPDALSPSVKSLNYLNNILARIEANQRGADEALMLDSSGFIAEASVDNVFLVRRGRILTPWTSTSLAGVTREVVIELASSLGIPLEERPFSQYDAWVADELFISGTAAEVVPIVDVDGRTIGAGEIGPITQRISEAYKKLVEWEGTPIGSLAHA